MRIAIRLGRQVHATTRLYSVRRQSFSASSFLRRLRENPLDTYYGLVERVESEGSVASMPEFGGVIDHLKNYLDSDAVISIVNTQGRVAREQREQILLQLFHVSMDFVVTQHKDYPHVPPFSAPYPYIPTLEAITSAVGFIDIITRIKYEGVPKPYHPDRYLYLKNHWYKTPTAVNGSFLYLPVCNKLYLADFVRMRSVPIGLIGVATEPVFADAYYNSPLDFWVHDLNHIRRLDSYNKLAWENTKEAPAEHIRNTFDYINNMLMPAVQISDNEPEKEYAVKRCMLVLLFELFHEYAFAVDDKQLHMAFQHISGAPSPFEHMIDSHAFQSSQLESLRLENGNLQSGCKQFIETHNQRRPTIRYFMDKGPNFFASTLNKLQNGFYDHQQQRSWSLPSYYERTAENIGIAGHRLAGLLFESHDYSEGEITEKAKDKTALEGYEGDDGKVVPRPS